MPAQWFEAELIVTLLGKHWLVFCSSWPCVGMLLITILGYLSIMDFLRGQYVIYGPVRIILTEDEVWGQYNPKGPYITYWQSKKSLIFILHM